ncbi:hypothetical protein BDV96DRAFT_626519 [Lophiotrema nucula]|uniref:DUF6536 domain-containing protein n=1 Tax=Lophiotrema nucula TaxID=690887 RepID=A0A6A5ZV13_9PLEO|nr:hypothetical protein BDV96DRAFT_626519 [Lophiotrema nucula]
MRSHAEPVPGAPPKSNATPTEYLVPEVEQRPKPQQTWFQAHFGGLKRILRLFLAVAITVLVVNVSWLLYAKKHYGGIESGYGIIYRGDCEAAKSTNRWLHLLLNVLSTLLLNGSNAFLPTAVRVEKRSTRRMQGGNGCIYNFLVLEPLSSNNYYWTIATPEFLTSAPYSLTGPPIPCGNGPCWRIPGLPDGSSESSLVFVEPDDTDQLDKLYAYCDQIQKNASSWKKLTNRDCIQDYSNAFLAGRRNVILVSSDHNDTDSIPKYEVSELSSDGGNTVCQPDSFLSKPDNWTVYDHPIDYCLSEEVKDVCEVEFSMSIMLVVIVFNLIKVFAMTLVLLRYDAESILTSVGDSVSSFLTTEDETTRGMCLTDRRNIDQLWRQPLMVSGARGEQRGTWLLGTPLVYGLPLLVLQAILHTLVSQSIFVVLLNVYNPDGSPNQNYPRFLNCGYSPIAIIFTIIALGLLILSMIAFAWRRFPQCAPPVVATCSAAISATCHSPSNIHKHNFLYASIR